MNWPSSLAPTESRLQFALGDRRENTMTGAIMFQRQNALRTSWLLCASLVVAYGILPVYAQEEQGVPAPTSPPTALAIPQWKKNGATHLTRGATDCLMWDQPRRGAARPSTSVEVRIVPSAAMGGPGGRSSRKRIDSMRDGTSSVTEGQVGLSCNGYPARRRRTSSLKT
jgi:hypothetical protein